eukprot:gnl/MRDRNA2_/MRDRNA2_105726_c0_seq1.p1 gnl/MRDRNA2_/MRDRNA2_105726_c0~~gnl/MRDRNA2_/MRDRNA2_105726_c0_seq1.p1  ORF type:complete len:429 (-),score=75.80 gnl/MRDRNA2_/MRDRNA2_105726_c0_seq1:259-1545(-)
MDIAVGGVSSDPDVCVSDRLIPSRDTVERNIGRLKLERDENWAPQNQYQEVLSQSVFGKEGLGDNKVLSFKRKVERKSNDSVKDELRVLCSIGPDTACRQKITRAIEKQATKVLDAPGITDDFYVQPIDWSSQNIVAVALAEQVFLFDYGTSRAEKLCSLKNGEVVTSVRWTGEGFHLAIGTNNNEVQIWDAPVQRQLRRLQGHRGHICALSWNDHMLSSGSADAEVHQHDVRERNHLVQRLTGHEDMVCGLDYNSEGLLASGGNDNKVMIWDCAMGGSGPLLALTEHRAAVKALRWCPWQRHLLASGGGSADRQICLWNSQSGRLLVTADTESQVTGLAWGLQERELASAHGFHRNQLSLWRYPSLTKITDIEGHTARILSLAQSPDGATICSASADETLRFWRLFSPMAKERDDKNALNPRFKTIR